MPDTILKAGDVVRIFEDPVTCEKLEGYAVLLNSRLDSVDNQEYWKVRFKSIANHNMICYRWVNREHN